MVADAVYVSVRSPFVWERKSERTSGRTIMRTSSTADWEAVL